MSPSTNRKRKTKTFDVITDYRQPNATSEVENSWADSSTLNDDGLEDQLSQGLTLKESVVPRERTRAEKKKLRHQELARVITPDLLSAIDVAIHPEGRPLNSESYSLSADDNSALTDRIIEDNIRYNTNCFRPSSLRASVYEKRLLKSNGIGRAPSPINAQESPEIKFILEQLGIFNPQAHSSKERTVLIKKLRTAIKNDVETVENEDRDTMMRMAGYWRYVNRKTYNHMVRHNQIWNWATGQKLEEVEEDDKGEEDADGGDDLVTNDVAFWDDGCTLRNTSNASDTPLSENGRHTKGYDFDDKKLSRFIRFQEQANDDDATLTPKVYHHDGFARTPKASYAIYMPPNTPLNREYNNSTTTNSFATSRDTRHMRPPPTSISTLKTEEPFTIVLEPSASTPKTPSDATFGLPHCDRNNRYTPLANLPTGNGINEPLGRVNKHLKIKPALSPLPSGKENEDTWTTVRGKGVASKAGMSYAAAVGQR